MAKTVFVGDELNTGALDELSRLPDGQRVCAHQPSFI